MRWGWWCDGDGSKVCVGSGVSVILGQLRGRRPHDRASLTEQNLSANMLHGRQAAANLKSSIHLLNADIHAQTCE